MITRLIFILCLGMNFTYALAQNTTIPLYVGTYTSENGSKGIYEFEFDSEKGTAVLKREAETASPSFIARNNTFLLAANELTDGNQGVSAFAITSQGLKFINKMGTDGSAPCHVVIDKSGKFAVVSNYLGGALNIFSLSVEGKLLAKDDAKFYHGSSIDPKRQEASHIHSTFIGPDGLFYVSDLGADKIYVLDVQQGPSGKYKFKDVDLIETKKGGGPRHLAFHPKGNILYSLMEMTGDIEVFKKVDGTWNSAQLISMHAAGFTGKSGAADVKISADGKFLYSTDRIDANSISVFSISRNGKLKKLQVTSVLGKGPRNFNFSPDERFVLVGNQLSDEIVVFNRNAKTGKLTDSGNRIKASKPVCILF